MSKLRFRLRTLLTVPLVVSLGMFAWSAMTPPVPIQGEKTVQLSCAVLDSASGEPIKQALVRVVDPFDETKTTESQTHWKGQATLTHNFELRGEQRGFRKSGVVSFEDRWLEVSAEGYTPSIVPLANVTGKERNMDLAPPAGITVPLCKGTAPAPTLEDVAGRYYQGDGLGANLSLEITADGRFAYCWTGCLGVYGKNYGFAKIVSVLPTTPLLEGLPPADDGLIFAARPNHVERCGPPPRLGKTDILRALLPGP